MSLLVLVERQDALPHVPPRARPAGLPEVAGRDAEFCADDGLFLWLEFGKKAVFGELDRAAYQPLAGAAESLFEPSSSLVGLTMGARLFVQVDDTERVQRVVRLQGANLQEFAPGFGAACGPGFAEGGEDYNALKFNTNRRVGCYLVFRPELAPPKMLAKELDGCIGFGCCNEPPSILVW